MKDLAGLFGILITPVIIGLFLITVGGFAYIMWSLGKLENRMSEDRKKSGGRKEFTGSGIKKEADVYTWEDNLDYLEEFNGIQLNYSIFEQFIPVFPLLGILGTVAGLIKELGNFDQMLDAVSLAMYTTFWGLFFAIVLKIVDALLVSKSVNKMALYFDTFEENYQMTKDKFERESEKQSQENQ